MCSWIKIIKAVRRTSLAKKGLGDGRLVPLHVDLCFELMEIFKEFDDQMGKNYANRYNVKPAGMEHLELVKDPGAKIMTGEESQELAINALKATKAETKRKLIDEGVEEESAGKAASRTTSRPKAVPAQEDNGKGIVDSIGIFYRQRL